MKKNTIMTNKIVAGLAALVMGSVLIVGTSIASDGEKDAIKNITQKFTLLFKGATPDSISKSEIPGLYTVVMGTEVMYSSADGRYLVYGEIIDSVERKNLTEVAQQKAEESFAVKRKEIMDKQDYTQTINYKAKDEKHVLRVFTDIDCPYCVKIHNEIPELNKKGVTVQYLMFPRAGVGSNSFKKAVTAWCSDDKQKALTDLKNREKVASVSCENPIKDQYDLGQSVGVTGTPALVTESGRLIPGYMPANVLMSQLEAFKK